jgi:DNA-binding GntR family transcriptional regulator
LTTVAAKWLDSNMSKIANLALGISRGDTLTDQAEAVLRESLMSGVFKPGQAITIRALSALLGISVTPAKDAMTRLIGERVLEWGPRRSALVPALTRASVDEIYTIRLALEATAAAAATGNIDAKGVAELRKIHDKVAAAFERKNFKNVLINNRDFHFAIYKRSELPMLLSMIEGLWLRLGPTLNLLYTTNPKQQWDQREGTGFHEEIIGAIESRDADAVRQHIIADLVTGRDRLEAIISMGPENPARLSLPA